jgi:hypothetical protein
MCGLWPTWGNENYYLSASRREKTPSPIPLRMQPRVHTTWKNGVFYKADCSSLKLLTIRKPFPNRFPNFLNASHTIWQPFHKINEILIVIKHPTFSGSCFIALSEIPDGSTLQLWLRWHDCVRSWGRFVPTTNKFKPETPHVCNR